MKPGTNWKEVPLSMAYGAFGEEKVDTNKLTFSYPCQSLIYHTRCQADQNLYILIHVRVKNELLKKRFKQRKFRPLDDSAQTKP